MSSTPNPPERPHNPTHYGGEGLYESTGVEETSSLKVPLAEQLDQMTRRSLQTVQRSRGSVLDFVRRNPVPIVAALGGVVVLLLAWQRRRSSRY